MSASKAACSNRLLRFEMLEDRLVMSASPTTVLSTALVVSNPTAVVPTSTVVSDQPQVPGLSEAVVQQPNGQILVAGAEGNNVDDNSFVIARYNADGTLDTSFGNGGVIDVGDFRFLPTVQQIKLESDGSFYIVGEEGDADQSARDITTIVHVEANGSLDQSYGTGGVLSLNNPLYSPLAAMQNDGKIVVAGMVMSNVSAPLTVVNRYNADGTVDTSFQPLQMNDWQGGVNVNSDTGAILVNPQGQILLAGYNYNGVAVMRLNSDGTIDTTFGQSGTASVPFEGSGSGGIAMTEEPGGQILLATMVTSPSGSAAYAVTSLNADGSLDTSFNGTGMTMDDVSENAGQATPSTTPSTQIGGIVVQSNGQIIVTTEASSQISTYEFPPDNGIYLNLGVVYAVNPGVSAVRFNADGSVDTSYGNGGSVWYPSTMGEELAATLQGDGSLLVVGSSVWNPADPTPGTFDVVRLNPDGSFDSTFGEATPPVIDPFPIIPSPPGTAEPGSSGPTSTVTPAAAAAGDSPATASSSQPLSAAPLLVNQQTAAPTASPPSTPLTTFVTNPATSSGAGASQQPAAPTAGTLALPGSPSSDPADASAAEGDANPNAIDLALSLASG